MDLIQFRVNARLPYWVVDGTCNKQNYYLSEQEMEIMETEYFPRLKQEAARR